jgi:hypothetical protein
MSYKNANSYAILVAISVIALRNQFTDPSCIPECRFYPETGRIEDSEVIQKHREREKRYRDNNAIVAPPHPIEYYLEEGNY